MSQDVAPQCPVIAQAALPKSITAFPTFAHFQRIYGEEPRLSCFIIGISRGAGEPWHIQLVIDEKEIRDVAVTIASKRLLAVWCRKSQKIQRWKLRQIIKVLQ
jgi:hypothetical protein